MLKKPLPRTISLQNLLSKRELEVFRLLMQGMTNKEIASSLRISPKTVEEHLVSVYRKMGVTSRAKAILWGVGGMRVSPH